MDKIFVQKGKEILVNGKFAFWFMQTYGIPPEYLGEIVYKAIRNINTPEERAAFILNNMEFEI